MTPYLFQCHFPATCTFQTPGCCACYGDAWLLLNVVRGEARVLPPASAQLPWIGKAPGTGGDKQLLFSLEACWIHPVSVTDLSPLSCCQCRGPPDWSEKWVKVLPNVQGSFTFPPQSHLTLHNQGASLGLTVPCSFPLCDAYHSGSVRSLCVGDKDRARSSCSLITKLIYQADVLLCRLCRVIQWARNWRCTRQGVFYEGLGTNSD